jgi:uncharacterized protein YndB with AHSA1/START domain
VAKTQTRIDVPPERVFAVLSNPDSYGDWVVGSHSIRDADPGWPAAGARFHHRVGVGPFTVNDHTEVIAVQPPTRLELQARARPLGTARVEMIMTPDAGGTTVTMVEVAGDLLSRLAINPLTDWLVRLRNVESLRRLKRIAETGVVES